MVKILIKIFNTNLDKTDLRGSKSIDVEIINSTFNGAVYNSDTIFPKHFNPSEYGMVKEFDSMIQSYDELIQCSKNAYEISKLFYSKK